MLNFLRQEIAKKEQERQKAFHAQEMAADQPMDEAILECAHLFNEMEELTIVGTNVQRERPVIDIPIEDDIELDLVEMDVKTGRIVDVPMDVQTSEAFQQEKTYDDFYQEAMRRIPRFHRESNQSYHERIQEAASRDYEKYHDYIVQEGLFGNDMMSVSDERVPSNVMVDLGPLHEGSQKHFVTKLPAFFETTPDHKISLNQIHALNIAGNLEAFEHMGEALRGLLIRDGYRDELYRNEVWDIATPIRVIIPIVMDKYVVGIEFEVEGMRKPYPVMWSVETRLVRQSKGGKLENKDELMKKLEAGDNNTYPNIKVAEKKFDDMKLVCKKDFKKQEEEKAVKEAYAFTPNRWSRQQNVYQEAIDFGGGGADPNAGGAPAPDPAAGGDAGAPPVIDGGGASGGDMGGMDMGTDPTATPNSTAGGDAGADPNAAATNPDASTATTNDISQQIADNVANATAANTAAASQTDVMNQNPTFDANVDDTFASLDDSMGDTTGDMNPDMGGMDSTPPPIDGGDTGMDDMNGGMDTTTPPTDPTNPASSLDDIETDIGDTSTDMTNDTSGSSEMGSVDIENMSMDDMIQQGIEKIKTMPLNQLKEFLSDGSGAIGTTPTDSSDDLSALEAAVMSTNTDLDVVMESADDPKKEFKNALKKELAILNDNKKNLQEIFSEAKKNAKYLNSATSNLIKSIDADKIAKKELENLNHALNEMVLHLNENPSREEAEGIKSSIKNFTNATRRVSKVIDIK